MLELNLKPTQSEKTGTYWRMYKDELSGKHQLVELRKDSNGNFNNVIHNNEYSIKGFERNCKNENELQFTMFKQPLTYKPNADNKLEQVGAVRAKNNKYFLKFYKYSDVTSYDEVQDNVFTHPCRSDFQFILDNHERPVYLTSFAIEQDEESILFQEKLTN